MFPCAQSGGRWTSDSKNAALAMNLWRGVSCKGHLAKSFIAWAGDGRCMPLALADSRACLRAISGGCLGKCSFDRDVL